MSINTKDFLKKMLELLPSTNEKYDKFLDKYGELLETVVIEDIFMPEIIQMLEKNKDVKLLEMIFRYFEEVSNCNDKHLINIFSTTVLEILGNDREILKKAESYMGSETIKLQRQAEIDLGRF